jgi:hypothetical protein
MTTASTRVSGVKGEAGSDPLVEVRLAGDGDDLPKADAEEGQTGELKREAVLRPEDVGHPAEEEVEDAEDERRPEVKEEDHVLRRQEDWRHQRKAQQSTGSRAH